MAPFSAVIDAHLVGVPVSPWISTPQCEGSTVSTSRNTLRNLGLHPINREFDIISSPWLDIVTTTESFAGHPVFI
jgi:hypothetical protein